MKANAPLLRLLVGLTLAWGCTETPGSSRATPSTEDSSGESVSQQPTASDAPSTPANLPSLPCQLEVRAVASVVSYHSDGDVSATQRAQDSRHIAISGDRIGLPVHVGHQNTRSVQQDLPFVLRRSPDGLRVAPAPGIQIPTAGNVADQVRTALAAHAGVSVTPGEWTTVLSIEGGWAYQIQWVETGELSADRPAPPCQVELRSPAAVAGDDPADERSAAARGQSSERIAVHANRLLVPVYLGHRHGRPVVLDLPFVLRHTSAGLRVAPAPDIEVTVEGEVADAVRAALTAHTGVLLPPGRWTTFLAVGEDASWQIRWGV